MNIRKLLQWTFSVMLIAMLLSGNSKIDAQPLSGDWTAQTDFGELMFTVNTNGTHIPTLRITYSSFSCIAGITMSGTITFSTPTGWPISNNQFDIKLWIDYPNESMTITGMFSETGTQASGIWSYDIYGTICDGSWDAISPVAVEDISDGIPERFLMAQNYPNPFNPTTTIRYQLPAISYVDLSIYNLLGQKIVTLVSKEQPAGYYDVEWNASGYTSGVYLYRLKTDKGFVQTRKLVLLR